MRNQFGKALVVEDDPLLRRALVRGLRARGIDALEAENVVGAERLLRCEPDLVLTDVKLPDGSGHDVARSAAALCPPPLVVAMSAEATPAEAFRLAELSVRMYMAKPFTVDELEERLAETLAEDAAHSSSSEWPQAIPEAMRGMVARQLRRLASERGLTPREEELVQLSVAGVERTRIPVVMDISENTCKTLVRRVLRKCGVGRLSEVHRVLLTRARHAPSGSSESRS
jgi:DNA-binding NarL/FixJ family response regulator